MQIMEKTLRIIIIEDVATDVELLKHEIEKNNLVFTDIVVETKEAYLQALQTFQPDLIVSDYALPRFDGMKALTLRNEMAPLVPFILVTGSTNEEIAVACMRAGADDYLIKGNLSRLGHAIRAAIDKKFINLKREEAEIALKQSEKLLQSIFRVAPTGIGLIRDRVIMEVNQEICTMTGYLREELIGQSARMLYPTQEDFDYVGTEKYRQIAEKGTGQVETRWIRKDGKIIDVILASTPLSVKDLMQEVTFTALDITGRKRVENALIESENKYRTIFENIQDVFYRVDKFGIITDISPSIYRYSGYSREELIGKPVEEVYENSEDRIQLLAALKERGSVADYDLRLKTKDGQVKWASLSIHLLVDESGLAVGIEGSLREVTTRKAAEQALKESEEKFRTLAESAPYAIMIYQDDCWVYANPATKEISGYEPEELSGMKYWEIVAEEFRERVIGYGRERQRGELARSSYELRIITKSGAPKWVFLTGNTTPFNGRPAGIISVVDISDRKRAEQALEQREAFLQKIFDVLPIGLWLSDPGGNLIRGNPAGVRIWGAEPKVGQEEYSVFRARRLPERKEIEPDDWALAHTIRNGVTIENELLEIDSFDGEKKIILNFTAPVLADNGEMLGAIVVNNDITALKTAETELINAKDKAQESDRLKSTFLANMSHEIRTPMNAILGFTELMNQPDTTEEERGRFAAIVRNAGHRLLHIINDIIDLSKLEAKQVKMTRSVCNIRHLMLTTMDSFRNAELLEKKPELSLWLSSEGVPSNLVIETDPLRLQQVLDNLIMNAIKYSERGVIETGARIKEITGLSYLEFFVRDQGKGIPADKLSIIFERFRQVEENEYHEGAGLGLSISKALVSLLGGDIGVESEVGRGTTFTFTVPLVVSAEEQIPESAESAEKPVHFNGKSILIAEDDDDSWSFMAFLLHDTGASVSRVENGIELMEALTDKVPDLLLLDINLPGKTGYECLAEIRLKNYPVKVIAQTAYVMADEKKRCMEAGCDGYLSKPFTKKELFSSISAAFMAV
jgi:PAS domain S-box-containing protein